jgi:hypothetical protein
MYIAFPGVLSPCHPPSPPSSLTGPLNPLPSWPSKVKSRPTVLTKSYRAPPVKAPVPPNIASGERTDGGSAGSRVHVPLSSLPVSLRLTSATDICANTLLTFRKAGVNVLVVFIPLAWVSHFRGWSHETTFARMSPPFAVNLCVHGFSFQSVSPLLSHSKRCFTGAQSSSQCTAVQTWAT